MKRAAALGFAVALLACSSDGFSPAPQSTRRPEPVYQEIRPVPGGDDGRMFYPDRSTTCDRATQICYVGGKANVAATERFLGDAAAQELKKHVVDAQKEPKWVFEPDGDTSCDLRTQVCYGLKGPNVNKTRKYFGEDAAARLEQNLGGGTVTTPKKKVGCDASVKVCYDENGPSVKLTRQYFGEEAAKKLKKQMPR